MLYQPRFGPLTLHLCRQQSGHRQVPFGISTPTIVVLKKGLALVTEKEAHHHFLLRRDMYQKLSVILILLLRGKKILTQVSRNSRITSV